MMPKANIFNHQRSLTAKLSVDKDLSAIAVTLNSKNACFRTENPLGLCLKNIAKPLRIKLRIKRRVGAKLCKTLHVLTSVQIEVCPVIRQRKMSQGIRQNTKVLQTHKMALDHIHGPLQSLHRTRKFARTH